MCQLRTICRFAEDLRFGICLDIGELFGYSSQTIGGHVDGFIPLQQLT
jgi:hypothetical protein